MKTLKQKTPHLKNTIFKIVSVFVLSLFIFSCSKNDDTPAPIVNEATSLELISGDNQTEFIGRTLSNPVEVLVKNQDGSPFAGATVSFSVTEGAVSAQTLITNSDGKAFVNWTLGETLGNQLLTVTSFVGGGSPLGGSPISVSATATNPCQTQTNPTDLPIGPNAGTETTSQITISDNYIIADVNITINLTHTFDGDLDIFLIAPTGLIIELSSDNGASDDNYIETTFDDDAAIPIIDGTAPFTGTFSPEEPLAAFNGINVEGIWTLKILDDTNADEGILLDWTIETCQ